MNLDEIQNHEIQSCGQIFKEGKEKAIRIAFAKACDI
jgi:hypothetical protein